MKIEIEYLEDFSKFVVEVNKIEKIDNKIYFYETNENVFFEFENTIKFATI